jgi:hypothetical protein
MVNRITTWQAILMYWSVANSNLKHCREDLQGGNQENRQVSNAGRLGKMLVVVVPEPNMDLI